MASDDDISFREIRKRDRKKPYEVRWTVGDSPKSKSFLTKALADNYRSKLMVAARAGESFNPVTGEPFSWVKTEAVSWYTHVCAYLAMKWPHVSARNRISLAEAMATLTPSLVTTTAGKPDPQVLRTALYKWAFNPSRDPADRPPEITKALRWMAASSVKVRDLDNASVVREGLGAISLKMDGTAAAAATFQRKRAVFYNAVGYAVELGLLSSNPIDRVQWTPQKIADEVDRRVVANPTQIHALLKAVAEQGARGRHLVAFFGCLDYAAMRPSEIARLTVADCTLPKTGWGLLELGESAPYAGKAWTDDGASHEERNLKSRPRNAIRQVPIPPVLVALLRAHIKEFSTYKDGRLFRATLGGYVSAAEYGTVWRIARLAALTDAQASSPLAKRPYDLRHGGVSLWLNSGVAPTVVAKRAGHSVAVLLSVYAGCLDGEDDAANRRIDGTLALYGDKPTDDSAPTEADEKAIEPHSEDEDGP